MNALAPSTDRVVGLAEVYRLGDMSRRAEDLALWSSLLLREPLRPGQRRRVLEVGIGDGRVLRGLSVAVADRCDWYGIEFDAGMIALLESRTFRHQPVVIHGAAETDEAWERVRERLPAHTSLDAVIVPYSTFYLLGHAGQILFLEQAAAHLRPGGLVAIEVFKPRFFDKESRCEVNSLQLEDEEGQVSGWVRTTLYEVDPARRVTEASRTYRRNASLSGEGLVLRERISWRLPAELPRLAEQAGFSSARVASRQTDPDLSIPEGSVVLLARA